MALRDMVLTSRRLGIAVAILFALFVLFDIALFGWLILNTLSQREIEKVLFDTREEAAPLARQLVEQAEELGQDDLFVVISVAEETRRYLGDMLLNRELVRSVRVRDRDGTVVYERKRHEELPVDGGVPRVEGVSRVEMDGLGEPPAVELNTGLEAEVPIGDLGSLVIGLSQEELQRRVGVLRRDLVRQASLIGAITVTLLGAAFTTVLVLFRRADRLERQAAEAERMAMIGAVASGLAHEFRNPLNSLNLNMQMLEEAHGPRGGSERRLLAITRSEISRLEHLVTDFLSYARPRPIEPVNLTAAALFERVTEVLAGEIRKHRADVRIRDDSAGATVRVDRDQMSQLLLNLVQNSLAAAAEAGRRPHVELRAYPDPGRLVLEVADNGCGIPEKERPKIFDLFFSTRRGGTGLGLAIVDRIAKAHGAEIEVESTPEEGTRIRVLMPRAAWPDGAR